MNVSVFFKQICSVLEQVSVSWLDIEVKLQSPDAHQKLHTNKPSLSYESQSIYPLCPTRTSPSALFVRILSLAVCGCSW